MNNITNEETVRIFALGGLDEDGKNMLVVEVDQDIYIIEAGLKFPEGAQALGVECIVPDFDWLIKRKDRIRGIFITHGHDDVMGALPYLLKHIKVDIFASEFTAGQIARLLKKHHINNVRIRLVRRAETKKIGSHKVVFFPLTHSYPQAYGLGIESKYGYIVYSGEFIQDYDQVHDLYRSDYYIAKNFSDKGVLVLMQDSKGAERKGHTSPAHRLNEKFARLLSQYEHRKIFVTIYTQSVYWIQEIIQECIDQGRKICFYDKELRELIDDLESITPFLPENLIVSADQVNHLSNPVIIISGQGKNLFKQMSNIASNGTKLSFSQDDIIVVATPMVPGVEKAFRNLENDIYKQEGTIVKIDEDVVGMHPAREDLKMMISLLDPKYYIPIKGEYRMLCANAMVAEEMGIHPDHILILDNYQVALFKNGKLASTDTVLDLHDTMIDGREDWDMVGVVLRDREILSTDGVMVFAVGLDSKTHKIINGPDIQTRGLIYLKDAEDITQQVARIIEEVAGECRDHFDLGECRQMMRDKVARYLHKKTAKRPMILPVILELDR